MKLNTVAVYNLMVCLKEDTHDVIYSKTGDK